ncbi:sulfotransferase [Desulfamplus magnetovallimortis]|nr:sulfotransferase [Desulfamplus magnetovallimortis]
MHVLSSSKISDHWKEKVLPRYAGSIFTSSLFLMLFLILILFSFAVVYTLIFTFINGHSLFPFVNGELSIAIKSIALWSTQIYAFAFGIIYAVARGRLSYRRKNQPAQENNTSSGRLGLSSENFAKKGESYSFFSKWFHYIALNSSAIREVAFDIDCLVSGFKDKAEPSTSFDCHAASNGSSVFASSSDFPAVASSSDSPAVASSSDSPAVASSSDSPAVASSSDFPAVASSSDFPAVASSSDFPAVASSSDFPAVASSSDFPVVVSSGDSPVFVTGLARSGTTILLEALYSTGDFATLTYRDMPFVTAPFLWRKISKGHAVKGDLKERAHKDRLLVNYDSPEAFEEVFWKTVSSDGYISADSLGIHNEDSECIVKYRKFVHNIIKSWQLLDKPSSFRYLAKNNNNLLRIKMLKKAFPAGLIVVPFRNPLDHAASLLRQHSHFVELHAKDKFALQYMNWLGHHEFGLNMKPFCFSSGTLPENREETENISYWLRYWLSVYGYLVTRHGEDVFFFDYDAFCENPSESLEFLSKALKIDKEKLSSFEDSVKTAINYGRLDDSSVSFEVRQLHDQLKAMALN